MLYTRRSFTCPASNDTSQQKWDYSFLDKAEFIEKYKITEAEYEELKTKKF